MDQHKDDKSALRQETMAALFGRYQSVALEHRDKLAGLAPRCRAEAIAALCQEGIDRGAEYPFDKMSRWLGFAQGVLAAVGAIDVDQERDFTRPLLHALHAGPVASFATPVARAGDGGAMAEGVGREAGQSRQEGLERDPWAPKSDRSLW